MCVESISTNFLSVVKFYHYFATAHAFTAWAMMSRCGGLGWRGGGLKSDSCTIPAGRAAPIARVAAFSPAQSWLGTRVCVGRVGCAWGAWALTVGALAQMGSVPPAASHSERHSGAADYDTRACSPPPMGEDCEVDGTAINFGALEPSFSPSSPSFVPGSPTTPTGEDYAPDSASNNVDDSDSDLDYPGAPHSPAMPGVCAWCNESRVPFRDYLSAENEVDADGARTVLVCGRCNRKMVRKIKGEHDCPAKITKAAPKKLFFVYAEHTRSGYEKNAVFKGCLTVPIKGTVAVMVEVDGRFLVYAVDCSGSIFE